MTVADRYVIDYIAKQDDADVYTLIMVEDRSLDTPELRTQTLAKVNEYMQLISSGELFREVPEARGSVLRVQYNVLDDPEQSPELMAVLQAANRLYQKNGIDFVVNQLGLPS